MGKRPGTGDPAAKSPGWVENNERSDCDGAAGSDGKVKPVPRDHQEPSPQLSTAVLKPDTLAKLPRGPTRGTPAISGRSRWGV